MFKIRKVFEDFADLHEIMVSAIEPQMRPNAEHTVSEVR